MATETLRGNEPLAKQTDPQRHRWEPCCCKNAEDGATCCWWCGRPRAEHKDQGVQR